MYWRMKLHPNEPERSFELAVSSLSRGYIGLDFKSFSGDLSAVEGTWKLPDHPDYLRFADSMEEGDLVLIFVRKRPFALAKVIGPYNYLKEEPEETLGVWFRHFRRVDVLGYYADWRGNTDPPDVNAPRAISRVHQRECIKFIDEWRAALQIDC